MMLVVISTITLFGLALLRPPKADTRDSPGAVQQPRLACVCWIVAQRACDRCDGVRSLYSADRSSPWRPLTWILGAKLTTLVSYSILALGWHFPSDVLGGDLMAGCWTLLAISALDIGDSRWPTYARPAGLWIGFPEVAAAVILALVLADALTSAYLKSLLASHVIFITGAGIITLLAIALPAVVGKIAPRYLDV